MKNIIIKNDAIDIAFYGSKIIFEQLRKKKNSVLCLATGSSVIRLYYNIYKNFKKKKISFKNVSTFNLDEYLGLSKDHSLSYRYFMQRHFFNHIDILNKNINFLDGKSLNPKLECENYEKKIERKGGIDLTILGIGVNGHIAFCEPGSKKNSLTHITKLSKKTIEQNSDGRFFRNKKDVPKKALTMGIATILSSKKIVVIANGKRKAKAIKKSLKGKITPMIPASYLQSHNNIIWLLDKEAASEL